MFSEIVYGFLIECLIRIFLTIWNLLKNIVQSYILMTVNSEVKTCGVSSKVSYIMNYIMSSCRLQFSELEQWDSWKFIETSRIHPQLCETYLEPGRARVWTRQRRHLSRKGKRWKHSTSACELCKKVKVMPEVWHCNIKYTVSQYAFRECNMTYLHQIISIET